MDVLPVLGIAGQSRVPSALLSRAPSLPPSLVPQFHIRVALLSPCLAHTLCRCFQMLEQFRMNRTLLILAVVASLAACSLASQQTIQEDFPLGDLDYSDKAADSRFLLAYSNSTSVTIGYNSFALGIAGALCLLGLLGLAALWAAGSHDSSYGSSGYADYDSGYSRKAYVSSRSPTSF